MPIRRRAPIAALLAAMLAAVPAFGAAAYAAEVPATPAVAPAAAVASGPKVVIVVGAVETVTSSFRTDADSIYAEAIKYTPNVVKVYSPNATWAAVSAAAQGASIFIYLGHGYGFPSPYKTVLTPSVHDGMGLNTVANNGDSDKTYYGESVVSAGIKFAKNAFVILDHACYSAGSSESGNPEPTIPVAKQRVDNFASGFLRAGARAVMADAADGNVIAMIRSIFTTHQTIANAWRTQTWANHHELDWQPLRNAAYTEAIDPDTPTTGFHRSLVGDFDMTTDDILAGASAPRTDVTPSALSVPGAAAVGGSGAPLTTDASLLTTATTLAAGTRVRIDALSSSPDAAHVTTLDGTTTGWTATGGLVPQDSASPVLWSLDGSTTVSPNFDGDHDVLALVARFSESVSWTATITDPGSATVKTLTGSGELAAITWWPLNGSVPLPAGDYSLAIHATDGWGNAALDTSVVIHVVSLPTPPTGVPSFTPTTTTTNATSFTYNLTFAGPVTGLVAGDFTVTGTAPGCVVGTPSGAGTSWVVAVSGCSTGVVTLSLEPGSVSDGTNLGPAGLITAHWVLVDRAAPTMGAPRPGLRSNVTLVGATLQATVSWTAATDTGGSGVRDYDVARSVDGAAFAMLASHVTGTSLAASWGAGHTYRFEVRARDKAGNVGAWVAGSTWYPSLLQQTSTSIAWGGAWSTTTSASYSGGSARYSTGAGSWASYAFTGRSLALVFARGPSRGAVQVWVDGALAATIDTYAAANAYGWVGYARNFGASAAHTVKVVVVGTAGRPTVVLDAIEVVR